VHGAAQLPLFTRLLLLQQDHVAVWDVVCSRAAGNVVAQRAHALRQKMKEVLTWLLASCAALLLTSGLNLPLHCAAQLPLYGKLWLSSHLVACQLCALADHLVQPRHVKVGHAHLPNHTSSLQVCQVQRSVNVPGSSSSSSCAPRQAICDSYFSIINTS
jgi:hypothetical protein